MPMMSLAQVLKLHGDLLSRGRQKGGRDPIEHARIMGRLL